jgi:hypothetical protein
LVKSSNVLNGPSPKVPRSPPRARLRASAVGRVDDVRRLPERAAREVAAERADGVLGVGDPLLDLLLPRRPVLVVQVEVGLVLRPRHREGRIVAAPDPLQIRIAPRRARRRPVRRRRAAVEGGDDERRRGAARLARDGHGGNRGDDRRQAECCEKSLHHLLLASC